MSNSDRVAMENCNGIVVVSAIFNDHDKIRQPKGLGSKTLNNVCFFMFVDDITLNGLDYHKLISKESREYKIGAWRIVRVSSKKMYENPAMNGVIPKYLVHRLFPNSKFSIWIDAKLQLMVDPLLLIHTLIVSENADMAVSKHPYYVHTMEEAMATARWKKWWDVDALKNQMETYCDNGLWPWSPKKLPYTSGITILINAFDCFLFALGLMICFEILYGWKSHKDLSFQNVFHAFEGTDPFLSGSHCPKKKIGKMQISQNPKSKIFR